MRIRKFPTDRPRSSTSEDCPHNHQAAWSRTGCLCSQTEPASSLFQPRSCKSALFAPKPLGGNTAGQLKHLKNHGVRLLQCARRSAPGARIPPDSRRRPRCRGWWTAAKRAAEIQAMDEASHPFQRRAGLALALNPAERSLVAVAESFANNTIAPIAEKLERDTSALPADIVAEWIRLGV